jgi:ABC-type antimicrobial peptide transport system permease subunit
MLDEVFFSKKKANEISLKNLHKNNDQPPTYKDIRRLQDVFHNENLKKKNDKYNEIYKIMMSTSNTKIFMTPKRSKTINQTTNVTHDISSEVSVKTSVLSHIRYSWLTFVMGMIAVAGILGLLIKMNYMLFSEHDHTD